MSRSATALASEETNPRSKIAGKCSPLTNFASSEVNFGLKRANWESKPAHKMIVSIALVRLSRNVLIATINSRFPTATLVLDSAGYVCALQAWSPWAMTTLLQTAQLAAHL